jgi:hypothetical protein
MAKAYNTKSLQERVNQNAPEDGGIGKAGLYRHPEAIDQSTGKPAEMVTLWDPLFGDAQSNAAERLGFERVGDAPEGYVKHIDLAQVNRAAGDTDNLKGLSARVSQLEGVAERNKELEKEILRLQEEQKFGAKTDSPALAQSLHDTKVSAAEVTDARGQGDATDSVGPAPTANDLPQTEQVNQDTKEDDPKAPAAPDAPNTPANALKGNDAPEPPKSDKALKDQNTTELVATAKAEGVEIPKDADTKAKIREAIEAHREKKGE